MSLITNPLTEYLKCPTKVLATTEMKKMPGGTGVLFDIWSDGQGTEWLVCKAIPKERATESPEGVLEWFHSYKYQDIGVYSVYRLNRTVPRSDLPSKEGSVVFNIDNRAQQSGSHLRQQQVITRRPPLNGLLIAGIRKTINDHLKKLRLKRKEPDMTDMLPIDKLEIEPRAKRARLDLT
ncbi:hypothetical protein CVT24_002970 [Panaeolus cyanescens]|uniref:Uncharacterized protein n=1 Tax=Panaeolus cyanescens TaxID=181874 RepID=A0A409W8V2_9AGAR|nr:hypothetical protein CVT24_002970 [Panaeolus cyanescens]